MQAAAAAAALRKLIKRSVYKLHKRNQFTLAGVLGYYLYSTGWLTNCKSVLTLKMQR